MGEYLNALILAVHVLVGLAIIGLVLMQHGKGADMGASFGSGASGSLFGASGSANFLSRTTGVLAGVFFVTSLSLTYLSTHMSGANHHTVIDGIEQQAPAKPEPAPAPAGKSSEMPK